MHVIEKTNSTAVFAADILSCNLPPDLHITAQSPQVQFTLYTLTPPLCFVRAPQILKPSFHVIPLLWIFLLVAADVY